MKDLRITSERSKLNREFYLKRGGVSSARGECVTSGEGVARSTGSVSRSIFFLIGALLLRTDRVNLESKP